MKILFINGSGNKEGKTANLAKILLEGKEYETFNLIDYRINVYGQMLEGDQFNIVLEKVKKSDVIVIGSPVYWHNICGSVRNFLDRFYDPVEEDSLNGKLFFIYQGGAPQDWMLRDGEYTMDRFAGLYGLDYQGMVTNEADAKKLSMKL